MATLSLTLPISCQICLGKVKDPVICPNNHAFCTICLDMWLEGNNCCPTCRVDITKEKPYRKILGSGENNEGQSSQTRMQLRKSRLELLGREYETEIQNLSSEVNQITEENKRLKEQLKTEENLSTIADKNSCTNLSPNNTEAFANLTKRLQEISSTYDDVQRDINKLQEDKEHLQGENNDLKTEVARLKEDSKFTKSPKRFEKFTITGLKAKVDQYEKENQQLRKALQKSDQYVEQLQNELNRIKSADVKGVCERSTQVNIKVEEDTESIEDNGDHNGSFTNSTDPFFKHLNTSSTRLPCAKGVSHHNQTSVSHTSQLITTESHTSQSTSGPHSTFPGNTNTDSYLSRAFPAVPIPSSTGGEYPQGKELFPATKKLLELKKIHETRSNLASSSPLVRVQSQPSSALDSQWSSSVSVGNYDSSNDTPDENSRAAATTAADKGRSRDGHVGNRSCYETRSCPLTPQGDERGSCMNQGDERGSCMKQGEEKGSCMKQGDERESCMEHPSISGVALQISAATSVPESSTLCHKDSHISDQKNCGSPKRKDYQPVFTNKKVKIENP